MEHKILNRLHGKDYSFSIIDVTSTKPGWMYDSFFWEEDIRKKHWKIAKGDVVFDVGAGFGSYTLRALSLGASKVFAIEPDREMLFDLISNLSLNNFKGRCFVLPWMASDKHVPEIGAYFHHTNSAVMKMDEEYEPRLLCSIDSIVKFYKIRRLDWIKIDAEGMEEHVIDGAANTLHRKKPKVIVECHEGYVPGIADTISKMMKGFGYKEKRIGGKGDNDIWGIFT